MTYSSVPNYLSEDIDVTEKSVFEKIDLIEYNLIEQIDRNPEYLRIFNQVLFKMAYTLISDMHNIVLCMGYNLKGYEQAGKQQEELLRIEDAFDFANGIITIEINYNTISSDVYRYQNDLYKLKTVELLMQRKLEQNIQWLDYFTLKNVEKDDELLSLNNYLFEDNYLNHAVSILLSYPNNIIPTLINIAKQSEKRENQLGFTLDELLNKFLFELDDLFLRHHFS